MIVTNVMSQIFISQRFRERSAKPLRFNNVGDARLPCPLSHSGSFSLKLILKGETYGELKGSRTGDGIIALAALAYSLWVIVSGTSDLTTFILGIGLFSSVLRSTRSSTKVQNNQV
ncbi:hypothetical protein PO124_08080 [Bacillus licheniformis]|nr:hypothetical protein [Bacillus licheniformis]